MQNDIEPYVTSALFEALVMKNRGIRKLCVPAIWFLWNLQRTRPEHDETIRQKVTELHLTATQFSPIAQNPFEQDGSAETCPVSYVTATVLGANQNSVHVL